ncbi:MAG: hypothetical protein QOF51_2349 [Chloroflexota bacterium]|nr:hypothetical protein [Chloroflexota bacterium]
MLEPNRPALTPAMVSAALIALIAPVAEFLSAFGLYTFTAAQQTAVNHLLIALTGFAGVLLLADSYLRGKRNDAHAAVAQRKPTALVPTVSTSSGSAQAASTVGVQNARTTPTDSEQDGDTDLPAELEDTPPADPSSIPPDKGDAGTGQPPKVKS